MAAILAFILTPLGRLIAGGAMIAFLVFAFGAQQRSIGAAKAVAKIEAKNNEAVSIAGKAGAASRNPSSRGVRDPYSVD
jgi:hypothetical protein